MKKLNASPSQCIGRNFTCPNLPSVEISASDGRRTLVQALACRESRCIQEGRILIETEFSGVKITERINPAWLRKEQQGKLEDYVRFSEAVDASALASNEALLELRRRFKESE